MKVVIFRYGTALKLISKVLMNEGHRVFSIFPNKPFSDKPFSDKEMKIIEGADIYMTTGTWGSKHISRQGRDNFSIMNHVNGLVEGFSVKYGKPLIVTESSTLSRIKVNYVNCWYKKILPLYHRISSKHWVWNKGNFPLMRKENRLQNMIDNFENKKIRAANIYDHKWKNKKDGAILILPGLESDPTSSIPVVDFINQSIKKIRSITDRRIIIKPHPASNIDLKKIIENKEYFHLDKIHSTHFDNVFFKSSKELINSFISEIYCGVIDNSTSVFQLINKGIPCFTSHYSFGESLNNNNLDNIESIYYASSEEVLHWYKLMSYTEYTVPELRSSMIIDVINELVSICKTKDANPEGVIKFQ